MTDSPDALRLKSNHFLVKRRKMTELEIKCHEYAKAFWAQITDALGSNQGAFEYLPIVFDCNVDICADQSKNGVTHYYTNGRTGVSSIYPVVYLRDGRTEEEIKQTIRHEVIHYFLGLQYRCHEDDSALFWIVCNLFDGGAYKPISEKSCGIFETAIPYFKNAIQLYNEAPQSTISISLALMLTVVDEVEASEKLNLAELKAKLEVCWDAIIHQENIRKNIGPNKV